MDTLRADVLLVQRGFFDSRARARAAIEAGQVSLGGKRVKKPSEKIAIDADITAKAEHPYVSRGGVKLAHALKQFDCDPTGLICLDVGASTGGFSDVLLRVGAAKIYAVDVGTDQLHPSLRQAPRLISLEQTDARALTLSQIPDPVDLIVCDASFISAMKVLERPFSLARAGAHLITLVKPQFEVGRQGLGRGGIVRDASLADDALVMVKNWIAEQGWDVLASCDSPIKGGSGNREFLLHAQKRF